MEQAARDAGARIIRSPAPLGKTAEFARAFRAELFRGRYDVLHGHHDLLNAVYFLASAGTPVRTRISHVHNADESVPTSSAIKRRLYREPLRQTCFRMADKIVGISQHTLNTFLNGRARRPGRDLVHYYGIDAEPFSGTNDGSRSLREENGIPRDAPILLFASRMVPEKNPVFAVDVLARLKRAIPNVIGVFAGVGSEEQNVRARAADLGVTASVRLLGWREDLPGVMRSSDLFILPRPDHPPEGFGLAVVEAQLAGLRMLLSNGIPDDPLLESAVYSRLPVAAGPDQWAEAAALLLGRNPPSPSAALEDLSKSWMDMDRALHDLMGLLNT
jgi:glycosyltransferase EpsF